MNPKVSLAIHLVLQILGQGAVMELVPPEYKPVATALVAVLGVIAGFMDNSLAVAGGWKKNNE